MTHRNCCFSPVYSLFSKDQVNDQVQYRAVLMESTSKDPWNVSNTKLQLLADHTYNW